MGVVHHIKTGGTIGGCVPEYREIELLADTFPDMINLDKFLTKSLKVYATYTETTVCHKDSREIEDADRAEIAKVIETQYEGGVKKFILTHGTYTMPETGKYLVENLSEEVKANCQILLTGSMFPWTVLGSDAPINLGAALGILLNNNDARIAICMHAKLFDPLKVTKDAENLIYKDA